MGEKKPKEGGGGRGRGEERRKMKRREKREPGRVGEGEEKRKGGGRGREKERQRIVRQTDKQTSSGTVSKAYQRGILETVKAGPRVGRQGSCGNCGRPWGTSSGHMG